MENKPNQTELQTQVFRRILPLLIQHDKIFWSASPTFIQQAPASTVGNLKHHLTTINFDTKLIIFPLNVISKHNPDQQMTRKYTLFDKLIGVGNEKRPQRHKDYVNMVASIILKYRLYNSKSQYNNQMCCSRFLRSCSRTFFCSI